MQLLFEIDTKDYPENGTVSRRPSVRGIIIRGGKICMVHSLKYDYYKFPGGGIEPGETHEQALIREAREEAGLILRPESIRPYGYVLRRQKGLTEDIFIQENYYYFCEAENNSAAQELDDYEAEEQFTPEPVTAAQAIEANRSHDHGSKNGKEQFAVMLERENRVLAMLQDAGLL